MLLYMGCCCTWDVIVHVLHVLYMGCCCTCCMCIVPGMLYMGCCCTRIVHGMLYMLYMYCTRDVAVHAIHVLYMRCYSTWGVVVHGMLLYMLYMYCTWDVTVHVVHVLYMTCHCTWATRQGSARRAGQPALPALSPGACLALPRCSHHSNSAWHQLLCPVQGGTALTNRIASAR